MSRTSVSEVERRMMLARCAYCDAKVGKWCVTKSGSWNGLLHSARYYVAWDKSLLPIDEWLVQA